MGLFIYLKERNESTLNRLSLFSDDINTPWICRENVLYTVWIWHLSSKKAYGLWLRKEIDGRISRKRKNSVIDPDMGRFV